MHNKIVSNTTCIRQYTLVPGLNAYIRTWIWSLLVQCRTYVNGGTYLLGSRLHRISKYFHMLSVQSARDVFWLTIFILTYINAVAGFPASIRLIAYFPEF